MKRFLFVVLMLVVFSIPSWAGKCEFPTGSIFEVTPIESYVNVTSYTVYGVGASTTTGVQRFFQNRGNGSIYFKWGSATNITTEGFEIVPKGIYIEDRYFGNIYFESDTTTNNMRYKILSK